MSWKSKFAFTDQKKENIARKEHFALPSMITRVLLALLILVGGGSEIVARDPQPKWEVVHTLEGVGLRETVHEGSGWDAVTVSAQQEFAAACDAAGSGNCGLQLSIGVFAWS